MDELMGELKEAFGGSVEFVCPEGEVDCVPAKDISELYPAPYRCFHPRRPTVQELRDAQDCISEVIESEGPFDGILGFSHGGEVAASLLLQQACRQEYQNPDKPFQFAVFVGSGLPFDLRAGEQGTGGMDAPLRTMMPETTAERIDIPTVHVIGRNDVWRDQARVLVRLCDESKARVVEHAGSHIVPRGQEAMEQLTAALDWANELALLG